MTSRSFVDANQYDRSFVEFETAADLKTAVEKLDGREFKGARVGCVANVCVLLNGVFDMFTHYGARLSQTFLKTTDSAQDPQ